MPNFDGAFVLEDHIPLCLQWPEVRNSAGSARFPGRRAAGGVARPDGFDPTDIHGADRMARDVRCDVEAGGRSWPDAREPHVSRTIAAASGRRRTAGVHSLLIGA